MTYRYRKLKAADKQYYDFSAINGTHASIKIIESDRGLGKSFGLKLRCISKVLESGLFIWVVKTELNRKELCKNDGYGLWSNILATPSVPDLIRDFIVLLTTKSDGSIFAGDRLVGNIITVNQFEQLKSNDYSLNLKVLVFEELIPEKVDIRHFGSKNDKGTAYKIGSIIQTLTRDIAGIEVWGLCNNIRPNDPIYSALGIANKPCGLHLVVDNGKVVVAYHKVDGRREYPTWYAKQKHSKNYELEILLGSKLDNSTTDIMPLPERCTLLWGYVYHGMYMRLCLENGTYYLQHVPKARCDICSIYRLSKSDIDNNAIYHKQRIQYLRWLVDNNKLIYCDKTSKNLCKNYLT